MPNWVHIAIVGIASLIGAIAGMFLTQGRVRFVLGWLGASFGFVIGFLLSLVVDPPLVFDPSIAFVTIPVGSSLWGLVPYSVVLACWLTIQKLTRESNT